MGEVKKTPLAPELAETKIKVSEVALTIQKMLTEQKKKKLNRFFVLSCFSSNDFLQTENEVSLKNKIWNILHPLGLGEKMKQRNKLF